MATYTSNLNLKKPALDDDALITDINNNMDILDAAANGIEDALAIVATGNTHAAITSGQFVYVRNHSTLTEGLYVASSNIAANATLSSSNLAADSKGGLNALSEQIINKATKTVLRMANSSQSLAVGNNSISLTSSNEVTNDNFICNMLVKCYPTETWTNGCCILTSGTESKDSIDVYAMSAQVYAITVFSLVKISS